MSTQEQLLALVVSGLRGDEERFKAIILQMAAHEKAQGHTQAASRLLHALERNRTLKPVQLQDPSIQGLLVEMPFTRTLDDLVLPSAVRAACLDLAKEHANTEKLRSAGISPRNRILLEGPPGNGKTALAGAMAKMIGLPLLVARYDAIISSLLGETLTKLRRVFDYAAKNPCVLLLDEVDTVGSERSADNEVGEMRRAVTTLLACVDETPSTSILITATNHAEMLDRAIWRRFQIRLRLPKPDEDQVVNWLEAFQSRTGVRFGIPLAAVAAGIGPTSFAELEEFCTSVHRRHLLEDEPLDYEISTQAQISEWRSRPVA